MTTIAGTLSLVAVDGSAGIWASPVAVYRPYANGSGAASRMCLWIWGRAPTEQLRLLQSATSARWYDPDVDNLRPIHQKVIGAIVTPPFIAGDERWPLT